MAQVWYGSPGALRLAFGEDPFVVPGHLTKTEIDAAIRRDAPWYVRVDWGALMTMRDFLGQVVRCPDCQWFPKSTPCAFHEAVGEAIRESVESRIAARSGAAENA